MDNGERDHTTSPSPESFAAKAASQGSYTAPEGEGTVTPPTRTGFIPGEALRHNPAALDIQQPTEDSEGDNTPNISELKDYLPDPNRPTVINKGPKRGSHFGRGARRRRLGIKSPDTVIGRRGFILGALGTAAVGVALASGALTPSHEAQDNTSSADKPVEPSSPPPQAAVETPAVTPPPSAEITNNSPRRKGLLGLWDSLVGNAGDTLMNSDREQMTPEQRRGGR